MKLARKTIWNEQAENAFTGLGQRVLMTDQGDYAMMDIQQIDLNTLAQAAASD